MTDRTTAPLKILLVAGYFPPYAPVSATRVNKMAKYFLERGHDIRVLAPRNRHFPHVMAAEIPAERIIYTPVFEVLDVPGRLKDGVGNFLGGKRTSTPSKSMNEVAPATASAPKPERPKWWTWTLNAYTEMVSLPDARIGWYPAGVKAGRTLLGSWRADVILASAPPHTGLLVAARLGQLFDIPWICEYRDLWVDHPYYDSGPLKRRLDSWLERKTLKTAAGFVTVTRTWVDWLKKKHPQPVELAMNGYDPADYPAEPVPPLDPDKLTIIYAGVIYGGKRDPSVLFQALTEMGEAARRIKVIFHVVEVDEVTALAERYGVTDLVEINGLIPRRDVIRRQCAADVLLLLRWDDPREDSVLAGKLFEYIGARRPILSLGSETGEAAEIIRSNGLGVVCNQPKAVAAALEQWLAAKADGQVPSPMPDVSEFARPQQFERLEGFLAEIAGKKPTP